MYKIILEEAAPGGTMELGQTPIEDAIAYCNRMGLKIPKLEQHLKLAYKLFSYGKTKREDMPVINTVDVRELQHRLKNGNIDFNQPYSPNTDSSNPFPSGLSYSDAAKFMSNGLHDKSRPDDQIHVVQKLIPAKDLKPIQKQVYLDKAVLKIVKSNGSIDYLRNAILICSSDNRIIDGHHRYLAALIVNPYFKVNCLVVDLPISKLLPFATAYGDAIGNERNF